MEKLYGHFYSKQNIYEFKGRFYRPRWVANCTQLRDWKQIYNLCIEGNDAKKPEPANWPKTVLVLCNLPYSNLDLWDQIRKSYPGLYAQSQLHVYAPGVAGEIPNWAAPWQQSGYLLMHEYQNGNVVWLRDPEKFDDDIYIFMIDSDPPEEDPDGGDGGDSGGSGDSGSGSGIDLSKPVRISMDFKFDLKNTVWGLDPKIPITVEGGAIMIIQPLSDVMEDVVKIFISAVGDDEEKETIVPDPPEIIEDKEK